MRKKFNGENNSMKSRSNSGSAPSFNKSPFNRNKSNNDRSKGSSSSFGNRPSFNKNNSSNNSSGKKFGRKRRFEMEDEEIDSDEAFNSQDDIKYGDIFDKKNKKKKGKQGNVEENDKNNKNNKKKLDLEESYDESDDGGEELDNDGSDDGKFVTLTDILDSDNDDGYKFDDEDDNNDDLEFDSEDEKTMKSNESSNHDNFLDQLKGMLGMKKKKIKGSFKEEGEYKKNPYDNNDNLQLEDLVDPLNKNKDLQSKLDTIKQDIEKLKRSRPTAQPLEEEDVKNINRDISYKKVKNKVNKWEQVIEQNRETGLTFGRSEPNQIKITDLGIKDGDSKLKNTIQNILRQSGIDEQQIKEYEDLTKNETTLEQLREREKELKKLRSIMFFEELKAKRQKKIKSKKYRKILRRKREKNDEEQMDEEDIERERVKAEKDRALERARLRHSSSSNWTKRMLRTGLKKETEIKDQIQQQRDLARSLKKKMGVEDSEEESQNSSEKEEEAVENQKDGVSGMLFMQRALEKEKRHAEELKEDLERMENPQKKEKKTELHDIIAKHKASIQKKQKEGNKSSSIVSEDFSSHTVSHKTSFKGNLEVNTNKKHNKSLEFKVTDFPEIDDKEERREIDEFSKILNQTQIKLKQKNVPQTVSNKTAMEKNESNGEKEDSSSESESDGDEGDINHFVNPASNLNENDEENNSVDENLDSSENENQNNVISDEDEEVEGDDEKKGEENMKIISLQDDDSDSESVLQITNNPWIAKDKKESKEKSEKKRLKEKRNEEKMRITETQELYKEPTKSSKKDLSMFNLLESNNVNQKEIVEQAFAVDDVAEEFEMERNQVLNENVLEEKEEELLGWGSWAGDGVKNQKRKRKVDPVTKAKQQKKKAKENELQELHKENKKVIINNLALPSEASKLLINHLPHPFNSLQEYEVGMGRPVGSEFNTRSMFKQFIQPDVKVYDGSVINPIEWDPKKMEKKKQEQNNNNNKNKNNNQNKKRFNNKNTPNKNNLPKNLKNKK